MDRIKFGIQGILIAACLISISTPLQSRVIHVPQDYPTIGEGIAHAMGHDGDEIIVSPGVYAESGVGFGGSNFNLHSVDPTNWAVVAQTIIKPPPGSQLPYDVIGFAGTENSTSRVAGFTITGGGTGVWGKGCHATIEYNHIYGNKAVAILDGPATGGGISGCDGLIQNNIIELNEAEIGGGLVGCYGVIQNNIIARNVCHHNPLQTLHLGTGFGAGFYGCTGTIHNNTIVDNVVWDNGAGKLTGGGGVAACTGAKFFNNILWMSNPALVPEYAGTPDPSYSLVKGWTGGGVGNFDKDPRLGDVAFEGSIMGNIGTSPSLARKNDYRLKPDSPCIDAGVTTGSLTTDVSGTPRGKVWRTQSGRGDGTHMDIGAYEFNPGPLSLWVPAEDEPGLSGQMLAVDWAMPVPDAPTSITVQLFKGDLIVADYGLFALPPGAHDVFESAVPSQVRLPAYLADGSDYLLQGRATTGDPPWTQSFAFSIVHQNAVEGRAWALYF